MRKAGFVGVLVTLLVSLLISNRLYASGFFLTRYELKHHSHGPAAVAPQYEHVVILLVDALRYDFAEFADSPQAKYYQNKLTAMEKRLRTEPEHCWMFRLEADPPTVTMQRIKGITTGSLPTFIDFKDNFHSNAVEEDSLIWQCRNNSRRAVFIGDDTWLSLFPQDFASAYPFDSFNVKDLDTVDRGVMRHLPQEMSTQNWTLIIGHMLGVDHVGHRYYADHPEMERKLGEVNEFLEQLLSTLPDSTLLLVFGDHGMTDDGNHGGTSSQETNSVLFAYSKRPFPYKSQAFPLQPRSLLYQIDLVPTLSLLLGIPIPFNNLGTAILELFQQPKDAVKAMYANALQVFTYLKTYDAEVQRLPDAAFEDLQNEFELLKQQFVEDPERADLLQRMVAFIKSSGEMCRGIWTTFDLPVMLWGMIFLLCTVVLAVLSTLWTPQSLTIGRCLIPIAFFLLAGPAIGLCAAFLLWLLADKSLQLPPHSRDLLVSGFLQGLFAYCKFSNSYILKEDAAVRFLLLLILFYCYSTSPSQAAHWKTYLACAVLVRLTAALDTVTQKEEMETLTVADYLVMNSFVRLYAPMHFFIYLANKLHCSTLRKRTIQINFILMGLYLGLIDQSLPYLESVKVIIPRCIYLLTALTVLSRQATVVYTALQPLLCTVGGAEFPIVLAVLHTQCMLFEKMMSGRQSPLLPLFHYLSCWQLFYASGHRCSFPALQIAAAFTGFETFNYYISGVLLLINTFSCFVLVLRLFTSASTAQQQQRDALQIIVSASISQLMTTCNTYINRRHLMVWPIFAPKYLFDLALTTGISAVAILSAVVFLKEEDKRK